MTLSNIFMPPVNWKPSLIIIILLYSVFNLPGNFIDYAFKTRGGDSIWGWGQMSIQKEEQVTKFD